VSSSSSDAWLGPVLVTGTDTGVGKTVVTAAIAAAATAAGYRVAVIKPVQTGAITGESDVDTVVRLAAPASARTLASYPEPLAPLHAAAQADLPPVSLEETLAAIRSDQATYDLVLIEGSGGLLVPLGEGWTLADLAMNLAAPAVVVTRAGLGTLNHTALTLEALERRAVPVCTVVGAWPAEPEGVHWANLADLRAAGLAGAVPDGAGALSTERFSATAPGWLSPLLHGSLDASAL
jgi:dethiobiotin synthetase